MSDAAREIENLVYTYAERIDAGDLDGVAALFAHGRICGMADGPPETVFEGTARVRQMYDMATRLHDDGTPKTKHFTTNVQIHVDESAGTARGSAYYCVTQATADLPLQVIVTGRYRDTFHRVDGAWWFDTRIMFVDQVGDTSRHLKFSSVTQPFDAAALMAAAQRKEGLDNWGDLSFTEPLRVLADSYAAADLNDIGVHILRSGLVHSLRMRLRSEEWIRRHPAITDETVAAPIVVVGMMRSGTTLLQRLLAADKRFHCAYGWEVVEVAPQLGYHFTDFTNRDDPRIAVSEERESTSRELAPELFAIHPMYAREPEEEIVFLSDAFLSHVPESGAHVPRYRSWIDSQDFGPAYDHLHRMLQFLQWQKRQAGLTARRWVLKSPAHLGYLDTLRNRFPDLHLVHMHRDPRDTIASGASLNATLHAMHADHVDRHRVGAEWLDRMGWTTDRAMRVRASWRDESMRCTDIEYADAVADPIGQVSRVYDAIGLPLTADAEAAMRRWLANRPRETERPPYAASDYGLTDEQIGERFAAYTARFRAGRTCSERTS